MGSRSSQSSYGDGYFFVLCMGALGVVFGDIGTSPLYALRECFYGSHGIGVNETNVLGVLSLIVWSLIVVIALKYISYIMHADNRGEGGELALMALAGSTVENGKSKLRKNRLVLVLGLCGAGLLYGDGMLTPAVSVLSAMEGLNIATPFFQPYIVLFTVLILLSLFLIQSKGTAKIGSLFGPVILAWFTVIALLGVMGILDQPHVLSALNPLYGLKFLMHEKWHAFIVLGSVFLAVTGGEALYADMGHFGRKPIQMCWFFIVFPALLLNYFGQGALLLSDPSHAVNPFYHLVPASLLYPVVMLATMATVIASQAVISGAFSITRQAVQLGYMPRLAIRHTSSDEIGQVYIAPVNWALCVASIWLVLEFRTSSNLAAAYGMAVSTTMVIATVLTYCVSRRVWKWGALRAWAVTLPLLVVDLSFFFANVLKIPNGGWFPIMVGALVFTLLATWGRGREILALRLKVSLRPIERFIQQVKDSKPLHVPGTAIFMVRTAEGTPPALVHNLKHNKVIHERVVVFSIVTEEVPHVEPHERVEVEDLGSGFYRVVAHLGFMDTPNVPLLLQWCAGKGLEIKMGEITYFLGRETILATTRPGMAIWREKLFALMSRNTPRITTSFNIPTEQVIEIGAQIEL